MSRITTIAAILSLATAAQGQMRITEYMYSGTDGEFIEFTNIGGAPIDMTGWSFDDADRVPGAAPLNAFGIVDPGESVVLTEISAALFATNWSLSGVTVLGGNVNNLARNDEINLYDNANALVDRLTYGDQTFAGSIRTQDRGGWVSAAGLGANNPFAWTLAAVGDLQGSYAATNGNIASPGSHLIPEPGTAGLFLLGGLAVVRRRRAA